MRHWSFDSEFMALGYMLPEEEEVASALNRGRHSSGSDVNGAVRQEDLEDDGLTPEEIEDIWTRAGLDVSPDIANGLALHCAGLTSRAAGSARR